MTLVGDQLDRLKAVHYDKFAIRMVFWREGADAFGAIEVPVYNAAGGKRGVVRPVQEVPAALKAELLPYYNAVLAQLDAEGLTQLPSE